MNIGKNWRVTSDEMNVVLEERHHVKATDKHPAHDRWQAKGYYSSVKNALKGLADFEVGKTELRDFETVVAKQDELYKLIDNMKEG